MSFEDRIKRIIMRKKERCRLKRLFVLWCFLVKLNSVEPYITFQQTIPNGDNVPDPCDTTRLWSGVGHDNRDGGGARNPFGADFLKLGKKWSKELCMLDSDGDGRSNGEELGDPDCIWRSDSDTNSLSGNINITHPGVCEPVNSSFCHSQRNFSCTEDIENCHVLREKDTRNITIRLPQLNVPAIATTYTCIIFEFPPDQDYHMVATRPVIDNSHVMHHILLFGCDESERHVKEDVNKPFECGMIPSVQCSGVIGIWSKGMTGECMHESTGFKIGPNGFKKGALQIHWNNEDKIQGMVDSSGMTIYYTSALRPFDAGIMIVGQYWIDLPPKRDDIVVSAECSSQCTKQLMRDSIQITRVYNHMHYLGREEVIELYNNGSKVQILAHDRNYSYDQPVLHSFQNPVEVNQGDQINVRCIYSTMSRSTRVLFGNSTSDEMCLGFITYFPKENLKDPYCMNWKSVSMCLLWNRDSDMNVQGCNIQRFFQGKDSTANAIIQNIVQSCDPYKTCSDWCKYSVNVAKQHPCFKGDVLDFIGFKKRNNFPDFLIPFIICDHRKSMNFSVEIIFKNPSKTTVEPTNCSSSIKYYMLSTVFPLLFILFFKSNIY